MSFRSFSEGRHCVAMAAHNSQRNPGEEAARARRYVVDIAARITWPFWHLMHSYSQVWRLEQTRGPLNTGCRFLTFKMSREQQRTLVIPTTTRIESHGDSIVEVHGVRDFTCG